MHQTEPRKQDLFQALSPKAQAMTPNSITGVTSSICKPNGKATAQVELMMKLQLEVVSPAKYI